MSSLNAADRNGRRGNPDTHEPRLTDRAPSGRDDLAELGQTIALMVTEFLRKDSPGRVSEASGAQRRSEERKGSSEGAKLDRAEADQADGRSLPTIKPGDSIPLMEDRVDTDRPFADLKGRQPVDDAHAMLDGWRKVRTEGLFAEAQVGRFLTVPAALLALLGKRRRAVARVRASGVSHDGRPGSWTGTGFLVGKGLFLTNHHVLNTVDVAKEARIEFEFEVPETDLVTGVAPEPNPEQVFKLDPQKLFVTSRFSDGLDYTFVAVDEAIERKFGSIPMERASFTVKPGEQAFVIHHPAGQPKQASLDDTDVLSITSTVVLYASDTLGGSSGSPVFDINGRLIALHHASQGKTVPLPDGGSTNVVNEGIKIGAIAMDLENRIKRGAADAAMAATVLAAIKGSDSLTGFFGGLGRRVESAVGAEAVVDAYNGTDQDVDVGFWNIEWLTNRYRDEKKLQGAAKVIVDLNLDIWGLSEVSPKAIEALVGELKNTFGETYKYAFSEPEAPDGKQSTAVIWKPSQVEGAREQWPDDIETLLRLDSRDPRAVGPEAVHGKIFDRYPGLFSFKVIGRRSPFDFFLVPLHLKAMSEGGLRRRLASRILARAVQSLADSGRDSDVILGGDINAPLASGDFDALSGADFIAMGAEDEQAGGFSYIKGPRSLIDNIFLSPNLNRTVGAADYFVVAKERSMDEYIERISDHRPVLVRLSLADEASGRGDADIDEVIRELLASERARPAAGGPPSRAGRPSRGGARAGSSTARP